MDPEPSSSQKVEEKSSASGVSFKVFVKDILQKLSFQIKHSIPSKNYAQKSLLDLNDPPNSADKDLNESKESVSEFLKLFLNFLINLF
jgi:hypothetical protein